MALFLGALLCDTAALWSTGTAGYGYPIDDGPGSVVPANGGAEDVRQMVSTGAPVVEELDDDETPCCMAMLAKEVDCW